MTKIDLAQSILRRVCKHGYQADYFLADSWFDGIGFIKQIREMANGAMHVICMAKNGNRKYLCDGRMRAADEMITLCEILGVDYLETMESIAKSPEQERRICAVIQALEMQDAA